MGTERGLVDPLALVRVVAKHASEVCAHARLLGPALGLLEPGMTPRAFLDRLLTRGRFFEAVKFLAFALPRREAIWWGCLCAQHALTTRGSTEKAQATLKTVVQWVLDPNEPHRHAGELLVERGTAAGWLAQAVAWTGGNLRPAPAGLPEAARKAWSLPPRPGLSHQAVESAVHTTILGDDPRQVEPRYRRALALGIHVGRGHHLWAPIQPAR